MLNYNIQLFADDDNPLVVDTFKAFATEEEFNEFVGKTTQSASSKAKGEILGELGIKSVSEAKEKFTKLSELSDLSGTIETKDKAYAELETKFNTVNQEYELTKETLVLSKYDVPETFKTHFKTLVKAGISDDKSIEDSAKEVFESLNLTKVNNKIVIGGASSKVEVTDKEMQDKLRKL